MFWSEISMKFGTFSTYITYLDTKKLLSVGTFFYFLGTCEIRKHRLKIKMHLVFLLLDPSPIQNAWTTRFRNHCSLLCKVHPHNPSCRFSGDVLVLFVSYKIANNYFIPSVDTILKVVNIHGELPCCTEMLFCHQWYSNIRIFIYEFLLTAEA